MTGVKKTVYDYVFENGWRFWPDEYVLRRGKIQKAMGKRHLPGKPEYAIMGLSRVPKAFLFAYKEPPFYERFGYP